MDSGREKNSPTRFATAHDEVPSFFGFLSPWNWSCLLSGFPPDLFTLVRFVSDRLSLWPTTNKRR